MNEFLLEQQSVTGANNFTSPLCVCVCVFTSAVPCLASFPSAFSAHLCLQLKRPHTFYMCPTETAEEFEPLGEISVFYGAFM